MTVTYEQGYVPGAMGRLLALQIETYAPLLGFGRGFEAKVAADMAEFLGRFDPDRDLILTALDQGRVVGGITLDRGEPDVAPGLVHLRWFVVDPGLRGQGVGRHLLARTLDFARARGDRQIYLTTVDDLITARRLYDAAGFVVTWESQGDTWGRPMTEQRLDLMLT